MEVNKIEDDKVGKLHNKGYTFLFVDIECHPHLMAPSTFLFLLRAEEAEKKWEGKRNDEGINDRCKWFFFLTLHLMSQNASERHSNVFSFHLVSSHSIKARVEFEWKSGEKDIKIQKLMINLSLCLAYEITWPTLILCSTLRVYLHEMSRKKSFQYGIEINKRLENVLCHCEPLLGG